MKTNSSVGNFSISTDKTRHTDNQTKNLGARKTLHFLQPVANDKENLVGRTPIIPANKEVVKPIRENDEKLKKQLLNDVSGKTSSKEKLGVAIVTAEDLTSSGNPSEGYWEVLAEKRRIALEQALAENKYLHSRVLVLEEKCQTQDAMLEEAQAMAAVLQDILND